jgi:hypothetical protein
VGVRAWLLLLSSSAIAAGGCLDGPYVIGRQCVAGDPDCGSDPADGAIPDGGGAPDAGCGDGGCAGLRFHLPLDASGPSRLGPFEIAGRALAPALRLDGARATATGWVATVGADLELGEVGSAPALAQPAPFTDGAEAVGFESESAVYRAVDAASGDLGAASAVIELIFRAAPDTVLVDGLEGGVGYRVAMASDAALRLSLGDGSATAEVASAPLVEGAWHHCLIYVARLAAGDARGRVDCNGQPGAEVALGALGPLASTAALEVGGDGASAGASELAELAIYPSDAPWAPSGTLAATLDEASARRFAALTGVLPEVAFGGALPVESVRASAAYLDLADDAGARRLFLVGASWPRVACRPAADGARFCGYLPEQASSAAYGGADEPADWTADAVTVAADVAAFPDGTSRMDALVPDASSGAHRIVRSGDFGASWQAFSFFARAGASALVGASAGANGLAVFDLSSGEVVVAPPEVEAAIEPWGDGVYRCSYVFDAPGGAIEHRVHLLADAAGGDFTGDGSTASIHVAAIQVETNRAYPSSLIPAGGRARDRLGFRADDGNVPASGRVRLAARVLVPTSPRLTDQAILNLSHARSFDDQMNLFLAARGSFEFDARADGEAEWGFQHPADPFDGLPHRVEGVVGAPSFELVVDGEAVRFTSDDATPPAGLDFLDVGHSDEASGPLEGLLQDVRVEALLD